MAGTTSSIISNLLSSLERISQFMPNLTSLAASSSSSISQEDVIAANVDSIQKTLMEDLSRLSRMLQRIQAVLHDAEQREIYDKAMQHWLNELREVAYDAENVLDQYDYQVIKIQVEGMTTTAEGEPSLHRKLVDDDDINDYQVSISSPTLIEIPISCNIAKRINKIIKKFDEIAKDREALFLRPEDAPRRPYLDDAMKRPPSTSLVDDSNIFGREVDKKKIIQLLMSHSEKENTVIPIVGLGGVGKTTLAQLIYNDSVVCQHFSPKVWVCISEEFDVLRITKAIVSSIIKSSIHDDKITLNDLHCILKEALLDKNYLLILDDVWNEREDMWEALKAPFSSIGMGKIIVTTRSMSVARIIQTVPPHKLGCLDDEKSWLLFQRHAFCGWEHGQQQNFEQFGRGITKKCGGLPLALKAIGGFLRYEANEKIWKDVLNNNLWELEETRSLILPSLRISYNYMPAHLKPCFLYASLFPKDHYFRKEELTGMWIAQGYIQFTGRKRFLEDIAFEFFEDLVKRSFFQHSYSKIPIEKFTLHDMVHDLAQFIMRNEICSSLEFDELKNIPRDAKHIFVKDTKVDRVHSLGNIRTLYVSTKYDYSVALRQKFFSEIPFSHLGCLRVFIFCVPTFNCSSEFIDLIGNLQLLRYLSIFVHTIQMTENSLCRLFKLQTLILESFHINMLPLTMGNLINLRHLVIHSKSQHLLPKSYFGSKNLLCFNFDWVGDKLDLSQYEVRRDGQNSNISLLEPLKSLRGYLILSGLENVVDFEDAKSANLQSKPYVESLSLIWKYDKYVECARNDDKAILEGLQPHTNLKELTIHGYSGSSFPCWFGSPHFSNLTYISLINFNNNEECRFLPLSKLPSLTSLEIICNNQITRMGKVFWCSDVSPDDLENCSIEEHVDFHSSKYLTNKNLVDWKEQPMVKNGDFSSLKNLCIGYCKTLQHISCLPSSLKEFIVVSCKRLECVSLPYCPDHFSRLQKVKIYKCCNLKSVINLNNIVGTLKVLKLTFCPRLKQDPYENFDHSFGGVSFEEGIAIVYKCPRMREWCRSHGFNTNHKNSWYRPAVVKELIENPNYESSEEESNSSSSDEICDSGDSSCDELGSSDELVR
ncbi:hypothetical protein KFK09_026619 [Dendrobium nobile]|uniref:Uncharacterized protein n=1 Tax=Dendrobium nobile TaxID=94219 RepID=A0A8T3A891_DENNO|nr:hypothetical protein KFK09_026619 [Dendrobium nobile]